MKNSISTQRNLIAWMPLLKKVIILIAFLSVATDNAHALEKVSYCDVKTELLLES